MRNMCNVCIQIAVHLVHHTLVAIRIILQTWAIDNRVAYFIDAIIFAPFIFSKRRCINRTHLWDVNVPMIAELLSIAVTRTLIDLAFKATIRKDDSISAQQTVIHIAGIAREKSKSSGELNTFLDFILCFLKLVCSDIECMSVFLYMFTYTNRL